MSHCPQAQLSSSQALTSHHPNLQVLFVCDPPTHSPTHTCRPRSLPPRPSPPTTSPTWGSSRLYHQRTPPPTHSSSCLSAGAALRSPGPHHPLPPQPGARAGLDCYDPPIHPPIYHLICPQVQLSASQALTSHYLPKLGLSLDAVRDPLLLGLSVRPLASTNTGGNSSSDGSSGGSGGGTGASTGMSLLPTAPLAPPPPPLGSGARSICSVDVTVGLQVRTPHHAPAALIAS